MARLWLVRNRNREAVGPAAQKLLLPKGTRSASLLRFELATLGPDLYHRCASPGPLGFHAIPRLQDFFFGMCPFFLKQKENNFYDVAS